MLENGLGHQRHETVFCFGIVLLYRRQHDHRDDAIRFAQVFIETGVGFSHFVLQECPPLEAITAMTLDKGKFNKVK